MATRLGGILGLWCVKLVQCIASIARRLGIILETYTSWCIAIRFVKICLYSPKAPKENLKPIREFVAKHSKYI